MEEKVAAVKEIATDAVRLEVRRAYYDLDAARQQVEVARAAIAQAQESLRINQDRYESGLSTITDLLGGRSRAPQPDGLLGGGLSLPHQLRQPGIGQRNFESAISRGDAMSHKTHTTQNFLPTDSWLWAEC